MSVLEAHSVTWGVRARKLVHDVSISLRPGEVFGLLGPNGAGKSSLVRLLAGHVAPSSGCLTLDGTPLPSLPVRERAARIGYLPQQFTPHWDYQVQEILRLGLERSLNPHSTSALDHLAVAFDLGHLVGRRWSTLSGGERGRALAAAVLAPEPQVIIADEPAAALDIGQAAALMRRLRDHASRGAAVAVVVHDLNLAGRWCDRIGIMQQGRLLESGAAQSILRGATLDTAFGLAIERVDAADGSLVLAPRI
ncbi:ABC transporter ATP-binding protein [Roseomonas sp. KE2513]|uniref:ABC transporter ATP-binding protein n=1 Tax=Roseomonas sp. KE2513 TaxID=2479202 RepID=UPI0018E02CF5|nr:ABC transporter ATP-binding protein [Roseomonas sp. KE2513]MBI0537112.1 ABC transporter ATP-binding protein [Roseomonas sp. KE2513]